MSESYIRNVVEAALLAAGRPLQVPELAQLFDEPMRPDNPTLRAALAALADEYEGRGIEVKETASGYRIQVRSSLASEVSRLWPERPARYSRALLETLALIAYRQPITRAEIEAVRGVAVNPNIVKTVIERGWVRVVGHREVPGRPELLGTTREFLDYFGLKSLDELPALAELKVLGDVPVQLELPADGTSREQPGVTAGAADGQTDPGLAASTATASGSVPEGMPDGETAPRKAGAPDSTADPFVEAVIAQSSAVLEPDPEPPASPRRAPSTSQRREPSSVSGPAPDDLPSEDEEEESAADGKPGMAARPPDMDDN
jgi:segregation and condensation protein B